MKSFFIKTNDKDVAQYLKDQGCKLVEEINGQWTFLNDGSLYYSDSKDKKENKKMVFSNILTV